MSSNNGIIKDVNELVYLGSNISSTKRDVAIRKAFAALNKLDKIWK